MSLLVYLFSIIRNNKSLPKSIRLILFIERTIKMLKKFGQGPGVRRTFRSSYEYCTVIL